MPTMQEGLVHELRSMRAALRGDILVVTITLRCEAKSCPVSVVKVGFREEFGQGKPMQAPCRCPRCNGELSYIGLERGR